VLRKEEEPSREQEQVKKHIMMVGSWPCTVSFEVHINGRHVSEPVQEDKGKVTVPKSEDEKDPKRTRMVLSKGREVVRPGYSRLSRDAASVTDRVGESGKTNRVDRVHREYGTDRRIDRVTRNSQGNRDGYLGWQIDWVTQVSRGNRDSNPKSGNSSRVIKNLATMENHVTEKSANTEIWVMQDSGRRKSKEGKGVAPSKRPAPRWCPRGIIKTQKHRLQKMRQRGLAEKEEEEERVYWFNRLRPMSKLKQIWREKWLAKEEGGSSSEEASKVTPARGENNPGSGDGNPESGNCNPESGDCHLESGNHNSGKENDWQREEPIPMGINMVFTILAEFCVPTEDVAELTLGVEHAVF
jgi:hypothetical protein